MYVRDCERLPVDALYAAHHIADALKTELACRAHRACEAGDSLAENAFWDEHASLAFGNLWRGIDIKDFGQLYAAERAWHARLHELRPDLAERWRAVARSKYAPRN